MRSERYSVVAPVIGTKILDIFFELDDRRYERLVTERSDIVGIDIALMCENERRAPAGAISIGIGQIYRLRHVRDYYAGAKAHPVGRTVKLVLLRQRHELLALARQGGRIDRFRVVRAPRWPSERCHGLRDQDWRNEFVEGRDKRVVQ